MRQVRRKFVFFRFLMESRFAWALAVLTGVALVALIPPYLNALTKMRVAVAGGGDDSELIKKLGEAIGRNSSELKFEVITVADPAAAAAALERKEADLAVVRTDIALPRNGATVLVLHRDAILLVTSQKARIAKVTDLARKRIGVLPGAPQNDKLLDAILAEFAIKPAEIDRVPLQISEVAGAIASKRIDAIMSVAPLFSQNTDAVLSAVRAGSKAEAIIVDISGAEGISARRTFFRKIDIPAGYFGSAPLSPTKDISVLGVDYFLQASIKLDRTIVSDLTEMLFSVRPLVAASIPLATNMEKPVEDKTSARPLHVGASAYYGDNEKTFLDRYGDWIYIGAMVLSGFGSAIIGLVGVRHAAARHSAMGLIDDLITAKERAHATTTIDQLDEIEIAIEKLSASGLHHARDSDFNEAGVASLRLAIDEARKAITDERTRLAKRVQGNVATLKTS